MFQALSLTWRMCLGGDLIAEIYRHSSEFLSVPEFQPQVQAVLDAVAQAGEEVVRQGQVTPATMAALTQDLAPADTLMRLSREFWSQGAAALEPGGGGIIWGRGQRAFRKRPFPPYKKPQTPTPNPLWEKCRGDPAGRPYLYGLGGGCGGRAGPLALALPPQLHLLHPSNTIPAYPTKLSPGMTS